MIYNSTISENNSETSEPPAGLRILAIIYEQADQIRIQELTGRSILRIHSLVVATTINEGLTQLESSSFDLIILDLLLPDTTYTASLKSIKEVSERTPVIGSVGKNEKGLIAEIVSNAVINCVILNETDQNKFELIILNSLDTTREKESTELDLVHSEEITRKIMNGALDAIICINYNGNIVAWNPQAEKMFGWTKEEISGKTLTESIIPSQHKNAHEEGIKRYKATGVGPILNQLIEITARNKEGREFPIELSVIPLSEKNNRFFCAFIRDISERKKAEDVIQLSIGRLKTAERIGKTGNWLWDLQSGKITWSEGTYSIFDVAPGDFKENFEDFIRRVSPEDREKVQQMIHRVFEDKQLFTSEFCIETDKGQVKYISTTAEMIMDSSGNSISMFGTTYDNTEQKRSEKLLAESEAKYRDFFENSHDGILLNTPGGKVLAANPAACSLFGMSEEEICAAGRNGLVDLTDQRVYSIIEERRKTGKAKGELNFLRKDGTRFTAEISTTLFMDANGEERSTIIIRDVTERKNFENALIKSELHLRHVLSSTADNFYVINRDTQIILINESAEKNLSKAWGVPVSVGTKILDVIPGEDQEPIRASLKKVFEAEKVEYELHLRINDLPEWVLVSYMPVIDDDAVVIGAYIMSKDISERKRIEAGLKTSIERFEMIAATTHDAIWEWNLETGEIWGNEVHQRLYGLSPTDPVPSEKMWQQNIHPDDRDRIMDDLRKTLATENTAWIAEYRFLTTEGYRNIYDRSYIVRNENKKPVRIMGSMMDITERTIAEENLKNSQKQLLASIENTPNVAVQWFNRKGEILFWNNASENIFGWSSAETVGKTPDKFFQTAEMFGQFLLAIESIERTGETIGPTEFTFRRKDNSNGICLSTLFLIHTLTGEPYFVCMHVDITERKHAEEMIMRSNERFELITKTTNDAIWDWNLETDEIWGNEMNQRLYGLTKYDAVPTVDQWTSRLHPDDRDRLVNLQASMLASSGNIFISEYKFKTEDKGYRTIYDRCYIIRNAEGKPIRMTGSMMDITETKKMEDYLRESEERYRSLVEHAPEALVVFDVEQRRFVNVSRSAEKLFKMSREELLKVGPIELSPEYQPDGRLSAEAGMEKINAAIGGEEPYFEWTHIDKHGNHIPCEIWLVRLPSDNSILVRGSVVDVTVRRKAEQALRESEEKYRNLVEQASDPILTYSLDGKLVSCNNAFMTSTGYLAEEIAGLTLTDLLFPEDMKHNPLKFEMITKGIAVHDERRARRKDGTEMPVELNSKLMPDGNVMVIARNITERKKAEELLLKEKDFSDSVINNLPGIFLMLDDQGKFLRWNKNFETISGYGIEEIHELSPVKLVDIDEIDLVISKIQEGFSLGETSAEIKFLTKTNEKIPYHFNGWRVYIENQPCLIGIGYDLTERKKADLLLRVSEEKYRTLVEQAVDAIALYDANGKILDVNTGSVQLLGYSKDELVNMYLADILTDDEIKAKPVRYDILQQGESTVKQRMMRKKDGSIVQTEVRSQQLPDGRFLSVIRDLTERIIAQEQIEREKELSDSIINSLPGLFYLIDKKGDYIRWNKLKEKITGYSADEMSRKNARDFFEGEEKELVWERIQEGFANGTTEVEAHIITKDGQRILYYFTGIAIDYEGQRCLMGTGIDISDRKKAEQELESSYRSIRQLTEHLQNIREEERTHIAREIHDELGQKLTVLKMDISWINKKLPVKDEMVKTRMKELLSMLDDTVQSVRRISSELRPSLLDDLGLIAAMEWHLNEFKKRVDIRTQFSSSEEIWLPDAMKTGLFRIFQESLTNVARHSNAKKVSVSLERDNGSVVLCVTDDGVGFDKQNAASKKTLGILGMKERTSMIGGTYEIISKPGKGTKVVVTVPLSNKN